MSYLNAPQTALVAANCCVCGRPLCDSVSVETGIGPVCREKYGYNNGGVTEDDRTEANSLVHRIAVNQRCDQSFTDCERLRSLGFGLLASRIIDRIANGGVIVISETSGGYLVTTPYNETATAAWRCIPGRRWINSSTANFVPASARGDLWALLRTYFAGSIANGPKGTFVI